MLLRTRYAPPDFRLDPPRSARCAALRALSAAAAHALGRWLDHLDDQTAGHLAAAAIGASAGLALCLIGA